MSIDPSSLSATELKDLQAELQFQYDKVKQLGLRLDITRGKPSAEQLDLSNSLNNILEDAELTAGADLRNYGGLEGIPAARQLGAEILGLKQDQVIAAGNSSLSLMYQCAVFAYLFGPAEGEAPWKEAPAKFICPVPGYDRHFSICQELGIEMITVPMTADGPYMDQVETLIREDKSIRGMWCVPKYSNPDGCTYSNETVERIGKLGNIADSAFRVFWDNAYAVHELHDQPLTLASIMDSCCQHGTEDSVLQFASTSKMTFAGAGMAWLGCSERNLKSFIKHLGISTIGADKTNQARQVKFLPDLKAVQAHMQKHATILKPRFDCALKKLDEGLGEGFGSWSKPQGGYFVSFDAHHDLAHTIIQLANEAGVKLTPAGSTFPLKKDPDNKNIRIAPSFPTLKELDTAMDVFVLCVKLATVNNLCK
jgi:DNA-binding transcriptional MocR family regulator